MFCPNCGQQDDGKANFCWACGQRFPDETKTKARLRKKPEPSELQKMGVFQLSLLTLMTAGLFVPIWFFIQRPGLNALRSWRKLDVIPATLALAIIGFGTVLSICSLLPMLTWHMGMASAILGIVADGISFLGWALLIWQSAVVRDILDDHLNRQLGQNVHLSLPLTVFFLVLYLQYKINRMPDLVSKAPDSDLDAQKQETVSVTPPFRIHYLAVYC
jgi:hypothetical protein